MHSVLVNSQRTHILFPVGNKNARVGSQSTSVQGSNTPRLVTPVSSQSAYRTVKNTQGDVASFSTLVAPPAPQVARFKPAKESSTLEDTPTKVFASLGGAFAGMFGI
ncbi:MAG: hypothetical protein HEQ32_06635 [Vampirovibrio sp.]|jgi:hypothetical protein